MIQKKRNKSMLFIPCSGHERGDAMMSGDVWIGTVLKEDSGHIDRRSLAGDQQVSILDMRFKVGIV